MFRLCMIILCYHIVYGSLDGDIVQLPLVLPTQVGDDVNLTCFCPIEQISKVAWFKQAVGKKPILIATSYHLSQPNTYYNDFDDSKRFHLERGIDSFNLSISKTEPADSATYYCAVSFINVVRFGEGTVLVLKGADSNRHAVLQQPVSEPVEPGGNVTLQCTIHSETCAGEHSVYWFRHGSGESHPGIIYTHGGRSDQCEKSFEAGSPTQSCVYNFPKRNLSLSDAGTYYCAVATCGQILFGNGTKLDIQGNLGDQRTLLLIVFGIAMVLFMSVIVNIILCMRMKKKTCMFCAGNTFQHIHPGDAHASVSREQYSTAQHDALNYAALKFTDKSTRKKRERREEETVYSGLSCQDRN